MAGDPARFQVRLNACFLGLGAPWVYVSGTRDPRSNTLPHFLSASSLPYELVILWVRIKQLLNRGGRSPTTHLGEWGLGAPHHSPSLDTYPFMHLP